LRAAWCAYLGLLILPFVLLAGVVKSRATSGMPLGSTQSMDRWFVLTMAYLMVAFPAALFYRRHLCSAYGQGKVVAPQKYLVGMLTVWLALEVGMIVPIVHCDVTSSFLPCLLPAILAFVFYMTLYPTGEMMTHRTGARADPGIYEVPR
jgi:hypothetical protein